MSGKKTETSRKIKSLEEVKPIIDKFRQKGKKIVLCHGVFDLLHPGHIRHLYAAKKKGDILVVTVTRDEYVNKGPGRPVFNHFLRAEALASLEYVDFVVINDYPTAVETIKFLKPDLYVKGKEYAAREKDITGKIYDEEEAVKSVGGEIDFTDDITFSSTSLLNIHFRVFPEDADKFLREFKKKYNAEDIIKKLKNLSSLKVLVLGDVIIDEYRYCVGIGKPQKDNIVATKYLYDERFAGGVLAVANHIAGFVKDVHLVSLLGGKNDYGEFIKSKLKENIKTKFFIKKDICTVVKRRFLDPSFLNKMFEIYFIDEFVMEKKMEEDIVDYLSGIITKYDVVVVADFGHYFITPAMVKYISKRAKFLAVNTQTNSANIGFNLITKYPHIDYICIDEPEIRLAMHDKFSDLKILIKRLSKIVGCERINITRGHRGTVVYFKKEGFISVPIFSQEIVDRTGAGDASLAITSLAAAAGMDAAEVGFISNAVGALAVLIVGNRNPVESVPLFKFINTLLK